ncbi:hypothetical protein AVEN_182590-1 [Araneus ventricosus]|uniref:Uncharacterized protein n=1 Tax=Araneus ventricosus TaxID=182803 RepID=A0A4Y2WIA4_ARAVE|nr:hypothetical protein AVEN_182590-1 [Araneus ventricosus]
MTRSPLITIINNGQALTRPRWDHTPSPDRAFRPDIRPPAFSSSSEIEGSAGRGPTTNQTTVPRQTLSPRPELELRETEDLWHVLKILSKRGSVIVID